MAQLKGTADEEVVEFYIKIQEVSNKVRKNNDNVIIMEEWIAKLDK